MQILNILGWEWLSPWNKTFFSSLMLYVAACHLECSDFSQELLKHVQFTLSYWSHLPLSPVANKITVLSSIEASNSEIELLNGALPLPPASCLPGDHWSSSCISWAFLSFSFSVLKSFLIPQSKIYLSNLMVQLLIPVHFTSLWPSDAGQHFFATRMDSMQGSEYQSRLELFHKPHISPFFWVFWISTAIYLHT